MVFASFVLGMILTLMIVAAAHRFIRGKQNKNNCKQHYPEDIETKIDEAKRVITTADYLYAKENNAIAATWHCSRHFCDKHKERDNGIFLIRGSWALKKKLLKPSAFGYLDEIPLPTCGCHLSYIYNLSSLPNDITTSNYIKIKEKTKKH